MMDLELFLLILMGTIGMAAVGIFGGLLMQGVDRKLGALMQSRIGPPLRQPWWDLKKLFIKENIVPDHALKSIFNAAPVLALASTITILLYIPFAGKPAILAHWGDLILIMYLLAMPALAMVVGVVLLRLRLTLL
jgi:formate hydrogenlyase subunit 4